MRTKAKYALTVLLIGVVLGAFYGCSPQKTLARRLHDADRVIATYRQEGFSITVQGADVQKLVQAIAAAKKENPDIKSGVGLRLEFYRGPELLTTVATGNWIFVIDQKFYSDTTGTLEALWQRYREEQLLRDLH